MNYFRLMLVGGLAVVGLVLPSAVGARSAAPPQPLVATVGTASSPDAYAISLVDATGARVTHVDPGTYTINVHDYSTLHNFHLSGPGVDEATSDVNAETTTWTVTFQDGAVYKYVCDVHPSEMRGSFTSGTVVTPKPKPKPKTLKAQVGPGKTISLRTASGAKAKRLTAGTYKVSVRDLSRADNFHLSGPGVDKKTGVKAKTTATWTVHLRRGRLIYRSDATKKLRATVVVVG